MILSIRTHWMRSRRRSAIHTRLAAFFLACSLSGTPAMAEYRLSPGDIVEIAVAGLPDIRQRTAIQLDGYISIPLVGRVRLQGLTAAQLQTKIERALSGKQLRMRAPGWRDRFVLIQAGDVAASVAEYRPIFVSGNVLTPNQYPYSQRMTARQAVALSGGYSLPKGLLSPVNYDQIDLRRDYRELSIELTREKVHLRRLSAELEDKDSLAPADVEPGAPRELLADLEQTEQRSLEISLQAHRREKSLLEGAITHAEEQIKLLETQESDERQGLQNEADERERVAKLVKKGTITYPRLVETRRAELQQSSGLRRIQLDLARERQERDETKSRLERLDAQKKLGLLQESAASKAKIASLNVRLDVIAEKMRVSGSRAPGTNQNVQSNIAILRMVGNTLRQIPADENTELYPGDVVEVGERGDFFASLDRMNGSSGTPAEPTH